MQQEMQDVSVNGRSFNAKKFECNEYCFKLFKRLREHPKALAAILQLPHAKRKKRKAVNKINYCSDMIFPTSANSFYALILPHIRSGLR
jgi:hypothetical protein